MNYELEYNKLKRLLDTYRYDYVTGLRMRHDFIHDIRKNFDKKLWLIMYDVNGLHEVNRVHGYSAGDDLLRQVANDLLLCRDTCDVYSTGGDEFFALYYLNKPPKNIEIRNCEHAMLSNDYFNDPYELIDAVDKKLSEKKKLLKRRHTDI